MRTKANSANADGFRKLAFFAVSALLFLSLSLASVTANAQSTFTTTASNGSVAADVWNGSGFIDFFVPSGGNKNVLSCPKFSFLTVAVGNNIYTNNNNLFSSAQPQAPTLVLTNGNGVLIKDMAKLGNDTIRMTWTISNSFQIIQDVFPVVFPITGSGQIVYKISIKNLQNSSINVQAQFLLDNDISTNNPPQGNDNDTLATRAGYAPNWTTFPNTDYPGIPPFELAFENGLCSSANFPGLIGVGFTNDSLAPAPMGLMTPSSYTFVDNANVIAENWTWGFPTNDLGSAYRDAATLIQWPQNGVDPNSETEIACGSYGVQECETCEGNLAGLIFHPEHIKWIPGVGYSPSPFPIEAIIFDPATSSFGSAKATQTVSGAIQIISPPPVTNNGWTQTHSMNPGTIQDCGLGDIIWNDSIDNTLINCSTDVTYNVNITVQGTGVGDPHFIIPIVPGNDTCPCKIEVDCESKDLKPPRFIVTKSNTLGKYDTSIKVTDDSTDDQGLQSITYSIVPTGSKCDSVYIGPISSCPGTDSVYVRQMDSTCATCVEFVATDCAGNIGYDTICFGAQAIPGHADEPPVFHLLQRYNWNDSNNVMLDTTIPCNADSSRWNVTDSIIGDLGLLSIKVISNNNMTIALDSFPKDAKTASFSVFVTDKFFDGNIILEAIDDSNHVAYDTVNYCTIADKHNPYLSSSPPIPGVLWHDTVWDSTSILWDRGVDSVLLTDVINCHPVAVPGYSIVVDSEDPTTFRVMPGNPCSPLFGFDMDVIDSFKKACWTGQVWDCAGNTNTAYTSCMTPDSDTYCPQFIIDTLKNPPGIQVIVYDIHVVNGDTIQYDLGVKSITFCDSGESDVTLTHGGNTYPTIGDSLPGIYEDSISTVGIHTKYRTIDTFTVRVTDTSLQGLNSACVCFNAVDGGGNPLCEGQYTWCYSLVHDTNAPKIFVGSSGCDTLLVAVTDSLYNDEGVYNVRIDSNIGSNFKPFDTTLTTTQKVIGFTLVKVHDSLSAYAQLSGIDLYGHNGTAADRKSHTDSTDVWMYSQDLMMSTDKVDSLPEVYTVPVYLVWTDSIPLSQKQLKAFQFQFHLTGSNSAIFAGATPVIPGWTVAPTAAGPSPNRYYTVTGQGPAINANLNNNNVDTLVYLNFNVTPDSVVAVTEIVIDTDQCQAAVVYNNGNDTTVGGQNYTVTLPAPTGRLNGGTIIMKGKCTPVLESSGQPSIISLAPTVPNPTANSTLVIYTIPADAQVSLELYNALGEKVRTLVSGVEKQGDYSIQFDGSGLPEGTYFLRLASGGNVVSRRIILTH